MKPELYALVGMNHRGTRAFVDALPNGEPLELRREANPYDPRAVMVWARGTHVGYIKASQNQLLAAALDRGEEFSAKLHRASAERWPLVEIQPRIP